MYVHCTMLAVTNRIFLPVGTVVMGWATWTIVTGSIWMDQESVLFLGMVSFYVGTLFNLQDFRDVEGDMKVHRKMMPAQFGMSTSKYLQSFINTLFSSYLLLLDQTFTTPNTHSLNTLFSSYQLDLCSCKLKLLLAYLKCHTETEPSSM